MVYIAALISMTQSTQKCKNKSNFTKPKSTQ